MLSKPLLSLLVIAMFFVSIFSPVVNASVVWGPENYLKTTGSPNDNGNGKSGDSISNGSGSNGIINGSDGISVSFASGPEIYMSTGGSNTYYTNFSASDPHGSYTLFVRNGDLFPGSDNNASSSAEVWLNGVEVFGPNDFKKQGGLLKKKVPVGTDNQIKVVMRSKPGSRISVWVEDESPDIVLTSPPGDAVSNGTILLAGYTTDRSITSVKITQSNNTTVTTIPVTDGNFSTSLWVHAPVWLNVSAIDSTNTLRTTILDLDGDYLPMRAELLYGFDPLNQDSDSKLTPENESGNGIPDGREVLNKAGGEELPCYLKYFLGADLFKVDSNSNGLTDYFEFVELHDLNVSSNSSEEMALPEGDPDNDGLTNIQEQAWCTFPCVEDTDGDGLKDGYEVTTSHTNPLTQDSDNDGLTDDSELKVGTDPNNPYSHGNGVLDGLRTYTTTVSNSTLGMSVSINGIGDMSKQMRIVQDTSEYYTNNSALISPLVYADVNGSFNYAIVTMKYDPVKVTDPANISLCYYNETYGLFLPVNSTVDPVNHTISANVTHLSYWGIFDLNALSSLYSTVATFNDEIAGYVSGSASIPRDIIDGGTTLLSVIKTYVVDPLTNTVVIKDKVSFPNTQTTVLGAPAPTPTPTPTPGPLNYSPIVIKMNNMGQTIWFGNGASFPVGVYHVNATGWYTHWYPPPAELACIDQGPDRGVRMYAWSSRGTNANTNGVRWGMHVKYGSNDSPVYMLRVEPGTLQLNHTGGRIGVWDYDETGLYGDNTYDCTYTLSYVGMTPPPKDMTDSDGDGLPDRMETHGWMDTQGNVYFTKLNDRDSDGDGLSDGEEAGTWVQLYQMKYFQATSNPNKIDSQ